MIFNRKVCLARAKSSMHPLSFFCLFGPAMWAAPKTFFWWRLLGALLARILGPVALEL
jgi:hypothetical protein